MIRIENLQRLLIPCHRGVAQDVNWVAMRPVGWQQCIELASGFRAERCQLDTSRRGSVRSNDTSAAPIAKNREMVAAVAPESRQRLCRQEKLLQGVDPQHAGSRNRGIKHSIGTSPRTRPAHRNLME